MASGAKRTATRRVLARPAVVLQQEYLRLNEKVLDIVRHFDKAGKPIAALCHGAQLLAAAGILKGRKLNCYPACATEVELAGGTFVKVEFSDAVVDGNLVTSRKPGDLPAFNREVIKLFGRSRHNQRADATAAGVTAGGGA